MILVGIDSVEIERIKTSLKNTRFLKKYFGKEEFSQLEERNFPFQSIAANFCAKEAFLKVFGKGLGAIDLSKIELLREKSGKPYLKLGDIDFLKNFSKINFSVSVTHTKNIATVVIVAEVFEK